MTVTEFLSGVANFSRLNHSERILCFSWYLVRHENKEKFKCTDIQRCFDYTNVAPPSSIPPFLQSMAERKRPQLLKKGDGYVIENETLAILDKKYGVRAAAIQVDRLLTELPSHISITDERKYLEEALTCFRHGAFRATIVMAWNLAYGHLCNVALKGHLAEFNAQLPKSFPKADILEIKKIEDFQELKESQVLQVCKSSNIISQALYKVMKGKLDIRNIYAHPSGIEITQLTAEEYVRDLVDNVALKLS